MLNWLHLTDLHWGLSGQRTLFPNLKDKFFEDLDGLLQKCDPWDLIFFTGDLVQSGKEEEFESLDKEFLAEFREFSQNKLGYEPVMLAVPGNHDLDRKALERFPATTRCLLDPSAFSKIGDQLFISPKAGYESEYKLAMEAAFRNYTTWWNKHKQSVWKSDDGLKVTVPADGVMPGDFSATFQFRSAAGHERLVGIVGLNTTYLQLAAGDFRGKLSWDPRQLNAVCGGDAPAWVKKHDACLLLTHQGPEWLSPEARREAMYEINPPGRFAVHMFGHEHELLTESQSTLGGPLQNSWQGASLFGLETYGEGPIKTERRHGYSAGRLDLDRAELRMWPRKAVLTRGSGWQFLPDRERCMLSEDDSLRQPLSQVSNSNWQAIDLDRAQADFMNELRKFGPHDEIIIRHLGLDMTRAKDRLIVTLREPLRAKRVTLNLLMLSEQRADFPKSTPKVVLDWSRDVLKSLEYIKREIEELDNEFKYQGRQLTLTIRAYAEVPNIHGFCLLKRRMPKDNDGIDERIATYFAFCRWAWIPKSSKVQPEQEYAEFQWGQNRYWKISHDRRDQLSEDMNAIFEGSFRHLWEGATSQRRKPAKVLKRELYRKVIGVE